MRPKKGQLIVFRPTNLKRGQISKKGQPGNPAHYHSVLLVSSTR